MADIKQLYLDLSKICNSISEQSIDGERVALIGSNHSNIEDYNSWSNVLKDRPEFVMIESAIREYQLSILANALGLYNLSFTGLRFFSKELLRPSYFLRGKLS